MYDKSRYSNNFKIFNYDFWDVDIYVSSFDIHLQCLWLVFYIIIYLWLDFYPVIYFGYLLCVGFLSKAIKNFKMVQERLNKLETSGEVVIKSLKHTISIISI